MKLRLKYPRLYAALAVTGLVHSVSAGAQDLPYCESQVGAFGAYRLSTKLYSSNDENVVIDFRVTLERLFSGGQQRIENLHADSTAATLVGQGKLIMALQYFALQGDEEYRVSVDSLIVEYPGIHYASNNIGIDSTAIKIADNTYQPDYVERYTDNGFFRSHYETAVANNIFERWSGDGSVSIGFFSQAGDKSVPYANLHVQADYLSQYVDLLDHQLVSVWDDYAEQKCVRFAPMSASSDCFLTTAATACIGLEDDCWELETLRGFRDQHLLKTASGTELVREYYAIAPNIVSQINARDDADKNWLRTYWGGILPTAIMVRLGMHRWAEYSYRRMVKRLQSNVLEL